MEVSRTATTAEALELASASFEDEDDHSKAMLDLRPAATPSRTRWLWFALFGAIITLSLIGAAVVSPSNQTTTEQGRLRKVQPSPSPPQQQSHEVPATPVVDPAVAAAISAEDAAATGFFADISQRLDPVQRVQLNYGISVTDVDGDHRFEAFVCGYGYPNTLIAWKDGSVRDLAPRMALAAPERKAIGVASCDMDGDGTEEIYVLNTDSYGGTKQFTDHLFRRSGSAPAETPWSDLLESPVNKDSRSSFAGRSVACVDRAGSGVYEVAAASYGKPLLLYEMADRASGEIRDVASAAGFVGTTGGRGLTAGPLYPGKDYRTRPGMDVFMANENGASFFFRNDGAGAFSEVAADLGVRDERQNGRGVALVDANADGRLDIAVGNWNGQHRLWTQDAKEFVDRAPPAMATPSPIRTVLAADFDNDGFQELFFNNICTCRHDMPTMCTQSANRLFRTTDGRTWQPVDLGSAEERFGHGTGAAAYDMDGDGLLELLISHGESKAQPLSLHRVARATAAKQNHYLRVLPLTQSGAPARGALVTLVDSDGHRQVRVLDPGSGYLCQQEPVAHFGLGAARVHNVTVVWPGGQHRVLHSVAVRQQLVVPY